VASPSADISRLFLPCDVRSANCKARNCYRKSSEDPKLIIRVITFEVELTQHNTPTVHQRHRHTDRQADRRIDGRLMIRAVFLKFQQGGRLSARPEGPTLEAQRAESGGEVLGKGTASPLPTSYRGSGERCHLEFSAFGT